MKNPVNKKPGKSKGLPGQLFKKFLLQRYFHYGKFLFVDISFDNINLV